MRLQRLLTPGAVALALAMTAGAAFAQSDGNSRQRRPRDRSPRAESGTPAREAGDNQSRGDVAVRRTEPRTEAPRDNRGQERTQPSNRGYDARQDNGRRDLGRRDDDWRVNNGRNDGRGAGNRGYDNRGYDNGRYDNRGYGNGRYDSRGYGWNGGRDRHSWRSRVRFALGVSIFAGNPFAFRFDYGWRPRFTYHYAMRPGMAYGGMSFLLNPDYAEVYIDGEFVGVARDFGGQPVPVAVGFHRIELYAPGFAPVAFDISVRPGQVIPYRGSLYPGY